MWRPWRQSRRLGSTGRSRPRCFSSPTEGRAGTKRPSQEIRLAVAGPDIDLGNVETALEALADGCYYLTTERNRYRFSLKENLNKRYATGERASEIRTSPSG